MKGEEFKDDFRKALPREVVQALTRRSAWRATAAVLHDFAVLAAAIAAALYFWPNPLVILISVVLIGTRQHALFVIAHDAAHYLLYERRWLNDLVGRLCATVQGLSMCTYRVIHRLHHNNLYGELDPDTALHGGYPRGRAYLVRKLLKDLSGQTAWKTYAYFLGGAPALNTATNVAVRPLDDTSNKLRAEAKRDRNVVVAVHLMGLAAFAWSGYLRGVPGALGAAARHGGAGDPAAARHRGARRHDRFLLAAHRGAHQHRSRRGSSGCSFRTTSTTTSSTISMPRCRTTTCRRCTGRWRRGACSTARRWCRSARRCGKIFADRAPAT